MMHRRLIHTSTLRSVLKETIPERREQLLKLKKFHGQVKIPAGDITIGSVLGGMRGNKSIFWQSTTLDPMDGIKFHGMTIKQCQEQLPGDANDHQFYPESMLWLLLTGKVPTVEQTNELISELNGRAENGRLPECTEKLLDNLPNNMHPMTQLAIAVASLNYGSQFAKGYQAGTINKLNYWESTLEDSLTLISRLPALVGKIYSKITQDGSPLGQFNSSKDWSYNICSLMGMTAGGDSLNNNNLSPQQSQDFVNLMRLYTGIHADHEGGNVSAHTTHLVGSALSDPFLSYSSGLMGLAGPLHGLAAQEVVRFLVEMNGSIKNVNDPKQISEYLWSLLSSNRVIPGYGHAVLRNTDPRFQAMLEFAERRSDEFKDDANVQLMMTLPKVAPAVLKEHGKCKNPYPNVDSASGVLFQHYGVTQLLFITAIFGCSRALGPLSQLVWDRIYGLPIERPKSMDLEALQKLV
ncbi:citrate (Si)-synthase CIT3 KNAG_0D02450 [Huiozyma naganishii CBS 8797]|uniref:Citrate synthase n=1 Tax=Huiozyma naganishii (strain ATCC MYA-139 / BCRC 22969 / CBS 8797 / KCTC 17520 / NBRC 10181 / NCYC 3082 / Yp74L-3) TaxID=1071383 RepID=J7R591_HUIN7|nr:hypothetical protein KNAG_0D02450 [Kazachstania naganishii CBS 8797]CCK69995.1 hypothetical protein KNAG_0D02450 [Kazachstania naganishii CBS 8797]